MGACIVCEEEWGDCPHGAAVQPSVAVEYSFSETTKEYFTRQDNLALARAGQKVAPELMTREVCEAMEATRANTPNPKTLMGRKRLPISSVLPWPALMRIAEAMQYGAFEAPRADGGKGYGPYNWRDQAVEAMTYIDANDRHKARWVEGQEVDPKSLAMELAHAAASLIILIDAIDNGTWIDNRPRVKNQTASKILDEYEARR